MRHNSISMHTTDELVDELMKRSVAGAIILHAYDIKSGATFTINTVKGDPAMMRGVLEDCLERTYSDSGYIEDDDV